MLRAGLLIHAGKTVESVSRSAACLPRSADPRFRAREKQSTLRRTDCFVSVPSVASGPRLRDSF